MLEPVTVPAICSIDIDGDKSTQECLFSVELDEHGTAYIIFGLEQGNIGFAGIPQQDRSVQLTVVGASDTVSPATGLCKSSSDTAELNCTAVYGPYRVTIRAYANWSW